MSPGASTSSCAGAKRRRILTGRPGLSARSSCAAVAPAAAPEALQQEHVVGIEVRPDAAAGRGVAHHQVVEARVGQEREAAQQRVGGGVVQVDALDQQRPVARRQRLEVGAPERSVRERPAPRRRARRAATRRRRARASACRARLREWSPAKPGIAPRTSSASLCQNRAQERGHAASAEERGACGGGSRPAALAGAAQGRNQPSRHYSDRVRGGRDGTRLRYNAGRRRGARRPAPRRRDPRRRAHDRTPTPLHPHRAPHEHLRQHRRHAHLRALRRRRHAARGDRRADRLPARRALGHAAEARGGAQRTRRPATRCRSTIEPADGFGDYDPELVKIEARRPAAPPTSRSACSSRPTPSRTTSRAAGTVFTVTDIADGKVVLDGNHPWAGKLLRFDCRILDVRPATPRRSSTATCTAPAGTTTDAHRQVARAARLRPTSAPGGALQLVERGQRVARRQRIGVDVRDPFAQRARGGVFLGRRGGLGSRAAPAAAKRSACGVAGGVELVEPREIALGAADGLGRARRRASPPAARSCGWRGRPRPRAGTRCRRRARPRRSGRSRSRRSRRAARSARSSAWRTARGCGSSRRAGARSPRRAPARRRSTCRGRSRRSAPGSAASRDAGSPRPRSSRP